MPFLSDLSRCLFFLLYFLHEMTSKLRGKFFDNFVFISIALMKKKRFLFDTLFLILSNANRLKLDFVEIGLKNYNSCIFTALDIAEFTLENFDNASEIFICVSVLFSVIVKKFHPFSALSGFTCPISWSTGVFKLAGRIEYFHIFIRFSSTFSTILSLPQNKFS